MLSTKNTNEFSLIQLIHSKEDIPIFRKPLILPRPVSLTERPIE